MFVELVFKGLPIDRDEVEEALTEAFGEDGEITGAGVGMDSCNLDLDIVDGVDREAALQRVRAVLADLGITDRTRMNVSD